MRMVEIMEKEGTDGVHGDLCYMDGDRIVRKWHQGQGVIRSGWMPGHPTLYLKKGGLRQVRSVPDRLPDFRGL